MKRLLVAAVVMTSLLVPASSALGSTYHPKGEFAQFGECPLSRPALVYCLFSQSSGGFFTTGKKEVPLVNTVTLQGGLEFNEAEEAEFYGAANGDTLSKTPQPVPGGLLGIEAPAWWPKFLRDLFNNYINEGATGVTATVEIAGPDTNVEVSPTNVILEEGTALGLPAKIKLSNPFLGNNCYIGSNSKPVQIDFTTGTTSPPPPNEPIKGAAGTLTTNGAGTLIKLAGGAFVNNSYAAPGANGCGGIFSFLIDPFVNSIVGLPSPAGTNTAVLEGAFELGYAPAVKASE